jgi:hypothetical protein
MSEGAGLAAGSAGSCGAAAAAGVAAAAGAAAAEGAAGTTFGVTLTGVAVACRIGCDGFALHATHIIPITNVPSFPMASSLFLLPIDTNP